MKIRDIDYFPPKPPFTIILLQNVLSMSSSQYPSALPSVHCIISVALYMSVINVLINFFLYGISQYGLIDLRLREGLLEEMMVELNLEG